MTDQRCKRDGHCWHCVSSVTDGMGVSGHDKVRCCFCGEVGHKRWRWEHDPKHGPYSDQMIRIEKPVERGQLYELAPVREMLRRG